MYLIGDSSRYELLCCVFHELVGQTVSRSLAPFTASGTGLPGGHWLVLRVQIEGQQPLPSERTEPGSRCALGRREGHVALFALANHMCSACQCLERLLLQARR